MLARISQIAFNWVPFAYFESLSLFEVACLDQMLSLFSSSGLSLQVGWFRWCQVLFDCFLMSASLAEAFFLICASIWIC